MAGALILRRYEPGDGERVRELHEAALRDAGAFVEGAPDDDLRSVPSTYLDGGEFLVGERDGRIVAMGALAPVEGATAEVTRLRVDPAHQRRGIGSRLLAALEERAADLGYDVLTLDTMARQEAARRFYGEHGYRETGRESFDWGTLVYYRKRL